MGSRASPHFRRPLRAFLLCVVTLQGVLWQVGTAAPVCSESCPADVRPVCGADGRSYSNGCVAACAEVAVASQGYCAGDKVRFQQQDNGIAFPGAHWRLAKESGRIITPAVLNKFADEGFVYRGQVDLGELSKHSRGQARAHARTAQLHPPKEHSAQFDQAPRQGSTARDTKTLASWPRLPEGRIPAQDGRMPAQAANVPAAAPAEQLQGNLDVAVVRVDNVGNMYTKTYTYDPKRYAQMAYPPFDPSGTTLVEAKPQAPPAATAAGAQQQQQQASARTGPAAARATGSNPEAPSRTQSSPAAATAPKAQANPAEGRANAGPSSSKAAPRPNPRSADTAAQGARRPPATVTERKVSNGAAAVTAPGGGKKEADAAKTPAAAPAATVPQDSVAAVGNNTSSNSTSSSNSTTTSSNNSSLAADAAARAAAPSGKPAAETNPVPATVPAPATTTPKAEQQQQQQQQRPQKQHQEQQPQQQQQQQEQQQKPAVPAAAPAAAAPAPQGSPASTPAAASPAGVAPQQQQQPQQQLSDAVAPVQPVQVKQEISAGRSAQQVPAPQQMRPDFMKTVEQRANQVSGVRDVIRAVSGRGGSSSNNAAAVADPVKKGDLIPEMGNADPKAFEQQPNQQQQQQQQQVAASKPAPSTPSSSSSSSAEKPTSTPSTPSTPSSSSSAEKPSSTATDSSSSNKEKPSSTTADSSSSSSAPSKVPSGPAAAGGGGQEGSVATIQPPSLHMESAQQHKAKQTQQQQQQQKGPQQLSPAAGDDDEAQADKEEQQAPPPPAAAAAPVAKPSAPAPTPTPAPAKPAAKPELAFVPAAAAKPEPAAAPAAATAPAKPAAKPELASVPAAAAKPEPAPAAAPAAAPTKPAAKPEPAPAAPAAKPATKPEPAATPAPTAAAAPAPTAKQLPASTHPTAPAAAPNKVPAAATLAAAPAKPNSDSSSGSNSEPAAAGGKQLPPCDAQGLYCRDKVMGTSPMFGTKPSGGKYVDQAWLVGKARISHVKMFYNASSGCLRGLQLTYKHTALAGPAGAASSGKAPAVQMLGSGFAQSGVVVKEMKLKEGEIIGKAEVWDPKCIKFLRLFTNKGQKVAVGRIEPGSEGQARNVTKNRDTGLLVALRGWQDPPKKFAATAKKQAGTNPGVLKQLQFVWGAPYCDHRCTPAGTASPEEPGTIVTESASLPLSTGHQRHLLWDQPHTQHQEQQQLLLPSAEDTEALLSESVGRRLQAQEVLQESVERRLLAQEQLQELRQQHRQRLASVAAAAESQEPMMDDLQDLEAEETEEGHHGDANSASVGIASIHRILSVIKPDNRRACPLKTYPYDAMGQIKAKASDGGFVCSGGLIGSNRVLTAGHCVWDDRNAQGPFKDLRFAPGQWKTGTKIESPFGYVDWDYVTLFDNYINDPDGEGLSFDVAVITLSRPVGTELGWLGVKADASPCRPGPLTLNLAGYPGEDPENPRPGGWAGGCFYDKCDVTFSCSVSITNHTCDSYVGQSGAPMYDDEGYVRAVHTLGVLPGFSTANGAITIQKFLLDNLMGYWKDTDGYTQTKTAAQASNESKRGKRLSL